jgi:hypothetical protein
MSDERHGLPSASAAHRYALCPGSFLLEQMANEPDTTGQDAKTGNRIHGYLAGDQIALSDEEQSIADACRIQQAALESEIFPTNGCKYAVERRLWIHDDNLERRWSGKPDLVAFNGTQALVVDYKTGRGEVEHATGNLQLRALAVLVDQHFGPFDLVVVAIVQPLAGVVTTCNYDRDAIRRATAEIMELMERVQKVGQPRYSSVEACKYCKAKPVCPEARWSVEQIPALVRRDGNEIVMTPDQIARFLEVAPLAEAVIESVRGKAKRLLEAGQTIPGWKLKPGSVRETITQPETVFARFLDAGGTQAQFVQAITVAKTKFKDAVKAATGRKGKELDAVVETILDGCTESKQTAALLVQDKEVA